MSTTSTPAKTATSGLKPLTAQQRLYYGAQKSQLGSTWTQAQTTYGTWDAKGKKWTGYGTEGSKVNNDYTQTVNNLGTQQNQAISQLRGQLSGRGTATSPMFAGQGVANIKNDWLQNYNTASTDKSQRLTAINNLRQQAQRDYNIGLQQLAASKALTRVDNSKLQEANR